MAQELRVPFGEAIEEPRLLKPFFYGTPDQGFEDGLGFNQRAMLKTMYGVLLDTRTQDAHGWTEQDYWAAGQGFATFDDLGFIKAIKPHPAYQPKEYRECWVVAGRRAGKTTSLAAVIVAYEAALGGHEGHKRKGRPAICYQIAQDTRMAKSSLRAINTVLESMDFIFNGGGPRNRIMQVVADRIDLWNELTIASMPPTVKSVRGYDNPVAVLDEVGVWYQDSDSANPDYEIYRAVSPGQAQFPHAKIVGISSPWNRAGLLYKFYEAGTEGMRVVCDVCRQAPTPDCPVCAAARNPHARKLIIHTTTAASTNPHITREWLVDERNRDPRAFERECLARFQDSLSGFLSTALIERARTPGILSRPATSKNFYIAAMDPAFRNDAFGFTIVHTEPEVGVIQDYSARWINADGTPLNPGEIFPQIAQRLHEYGIRNVYSDQYTLESLQFLAAQFGFTIEEVTFSSGSKAEIYGNLQQLLNQGRLRLLDEPETLTELKALERRLTQGGAVQIRAPEGMHDDMATVVAIAAYEAVWMLPKVAAAAAIKPVSPIEKHISHIAAKARYIRRGYADADW